MQWNCRSVNDKKAELTHLLNKHNPTIIALSETWLRPGSVFKIKSYSCLREDRSDRYAGVALLVKNNILYKPIPLPSHDDFTAVAALITSICFVSIYITKPSASSFQQLSNILQTLPRPLILLGDFNSHHTSFGSTKSDNNGQELLKLLHEHNLCLLNTGSPTRQTNPAQHLSSVDLSISSPSLVPSLTWHTLSSTYYSDHFPIIISFPGKKVKATPTKPRLKYILVDDNWPKFKNYMETNISGLPKDSDPEICSKEFSKLMIQAADTYFPIKNASKGKIPSPPWWDNECTLAIKKRKVAEVTYKLNMTNENFNNLMDVMSDTKNLLKKKKFTSWRSFCASISPRTPPSVMWTNIKRFRTGTSPNTFNTIPSSLTEEFLTNLAPPFVPQQELVSAPPQISPYVSTSFLDGPFSLAELKGVLSYVRDSAPGQDGIPYSFFSNLGDDSLLYYLEVINSVILTGDVPESWKLQTVLPILKPNKNPSESTSYRPIALSPVIAKLAEHLIKNRLEWFLENNHLLPNSQFGFRKGKSTMDNAGLLITDIRLAFSGDESVVAAFLDIKSAYDNVCLSILMKKLQKLQVPPNLIRFIINLLSGRKITINGLNRMIWKGLPQGSVLSPILYAIYTYDLESSLAATCKILQYADDVVIYSNDKSINIACSSLSRALDLLKIYLDKDGLELSVSKCSAVLFSRKRLPPPIILKYNGEPIPVKSHVKFLGLVLDSKLTGKPHCDYIAEKCERSLNILRCLSGVWWGAHPFSLKLVYNALIRSVLDYGTFLLEPCSTAGMNRLDVVQAKALRIITGAMKSSPINALQVECADPPLKLRRQFLADRFFYRIFQFSKHPLVIKTHQLSDCINSSPYWTHKPLPHLVISFRTHTIITTPTLHSSIFPIFESDFKALIISPEIHLNSGIIKGDPNSNFSFKAVVDELWPDWHHVYSDASKHTGYQNVGVGIFHSQYKIVQKIKLPPETSVFTAECFGIFKALEYVLLMKLPKTVIFVDSMSALKALAKFPFKSNNLSPVTLMSRDLLLKCESREYSVSFAWIPSHSGIIGNEKADQLANEAIACGDTFYFKIYPQDLTALPRVRLKESWGEAWKSSSQVKGKYHFSIQPEVPIKPWFFKTKFGKRATSVLIRMRLGHVCSPAHLARFRIIDNDSCECGEEDADTNHIILSCSLYDHTLLYTRLSILEVPFPTSIPCLLFNNSIPIYKVLTSFIEANDIKL